METTVFGEELILFHACCQFLIQFCGTHTLQDTNVVEGTIHVWGIGLVNRRFGSNALSRRQISTHFVSIVDERNKPNQLSYSRG